MAEESRVDKGKSLEAACDNLIDIENITTNGGLDILKKASHENTEKLSSSTEHIAEHFATKDTNEEKYIDQANFNKASKCNRGINKEDDTQPTVSHLLNGLEENRQEKILSENKARNSETEKEEGNYEELVCLVRQFYVERPVDPSAIAHHNIETC